MAVQVTPAVLVVDDDNLIRNLITRSLTQAGYSVRSAGNGSEALALLTSYSPQLLLLDLAMPGITGAELLQIIRNDTRMSHIPVIIISGEMLPNEIRGLAQFYLAKPFTIGELRAAVSRFLPDVPLQARERSE